jgi:predicted transcriptional regulator
MSSISSETNNQTNVDNQITSNTMFLPVSFGEGIDKLSILDIKLTKITDPSRKADVQKEYDMIYDKIKATFNETVLFHYKILKEVNLNIWNMQDRFRDLEKDKLNQDTNSEKTRLCSEIILENDRRFRIKRKLNNLCNSTLKEQKGYVEKKLCIVGDSGIGDSINLCGMVRYYSTIYDSVEVVCLEKYVKHIKYLYVDDTSITIFPVNKSVSLEDFINLRNIKNKEGFHVSGVGYNKNPYITQDIIKDYEFVPFCFYKHANINYNIFWDYFHIPQLEESKLLYSHIQNANITKYVIIHNSSSHGIAFSTDKVEELMKQNGEDKNTTLILNLDKNNYPSDHPFFSLAEKFVFQPVFHYTDTLINATRLFLSDSCFLCLSLHLNLKCQNFFLVNGRHNYGHFYDPKYEYIKQNTGQKVIQICM